jgi:hypothetical protein
MSGWLWFLGYWIGAVVCGRYYVLRVQEKMDRANADLRGNYYRVTRTNWYQSPDAPIILFVMLFWPVALMGWTSYKAAFPRGVITKFAKQRAIDERQAAKQAELEQMAAEIKKTSAAAGLRVPEGL